MHQFPRDAVLWEKWIKFVQRHRRDFKPEGKYTAISAGGDTDELNINKRISTNA